MKPKKSAEGSRHETKCRLRNETKYKVRSELTYKRTYPTSHTLDGSKKRQLNFEKMTHKTKKNITLTPIKSHLIQL